MADTLPNNGITSGTLCLPILCVTFIGHSVCRKLIQSTHSSDFLLQMKRSVICQPWTWKQNSRISWALVLMGSIYFINNFVKLNHTTGFEIFKPTFKCNQVLAWWDEAAIVPWIALNFVIVWKTYLRSDIEALPVVIHWLADMACNTLLRSGYSYYIFLFDNFLCATI